MLNFEQISIYKLDIIPKLKFIGALKQRQRIQSLFDLHLCLRGGGKNSINF